MKKAGLRILVAGLIALPIIFSGCIIASGGKVVTEKKDFVDFIAVEVGGTFEVEIARSDTFSVVIEADEAVLDYIRVDKVRDTLRLNLDPRHVFSDLTAGAIKLKAKIGMPVLSRLELSGASKGTVSGFDSSVSFELITSGANSLKMVNMKVGRAVFEISGASQITGNMTATIAEFEVSGASSIVLAGSARSLVLEVSGASRVDLADFIVAEADVELSGVSEATLHAREKLNIDVSGASKLYFLGNPMIADINVSGASAVKHKD